MKRYLFFVALLLASTSASGQWCKALPDPSPRTALLPEASTVSPGDTLFLDLVYLYPVGAGFDEAALAAEAVPQLAYMNKALEVISTDGVKRVVRLAAVRPIHIDISSGDGETILRLATLDPATASEVAAAKSMKPRADVALLRVPTLNLGGIAWISAQAATAIGVVGPGAHLNPDGSGIPDLFAHEIGHLLGLQHSERSAQSSGPYYPRDRAYLGTLPDGRRFETIMAYGSDCPGGCQVEVPSYSDPTLATDGTAFYRVGDPAAPAGAVPIGEFGKSEAGEILRGDGLSAGSFEKVAAYSPSDLPTCTPSATALCLSGGRFKVETTWQTAQGSGSGQAVSLTADTGYFWFFDPGNVEVLVKVLNGCGLNSRFWVFAGGLTNVKTVLMVTDTVTGMVKTYTNPQNTPFEPLQDTNAFASCP